MPEPTWRRSACPLILAVCRPAGYPHKPYDTNILSPAFYARTPNGSNRSVVSSKGSHTALIAAAATQKAG